MRTPTRSLFLFLLPLSMLLATAMPSLADDSSSEDSKLSPIVPEIVERSITYHGGDHYSSSRTELDVCSKSGCFRVEARVEGERFELSATGRTRDGQQTVRIDNEHVERVLEGQEQVINQSDEQTLRDWVMARVYFCFLPFRLTDPSVRYRDLGLETWPNADGTSRRLHKIEIGFEVGTSTDDDDQFLYWFDPETARLEQFAYSYSGNPGGIRFRQLFQHRTVGGILFFDQQNFGVESPSPDVHDITPDSVAEMRLVSTVTLKNISVESVNGSH